MSDLISARGVVERLIGDAGNYAAKRGAITAVRSSALGGSLIAIAARATKFGTRKAGAITLPSSEVLEAHENWRVPATIWFNPTVINPSGLEAWLCGNETLIIADGQWHLSGLRFEAAGVDILSPAAASGIVPVAAQPRKTSGRPRSEGWDTWIAQLAVAVNSGDVKSNMTESKVIDHINERLAFAGLEQMGRSTVQSAVKAVLKALRSDEDRS